MGIRNKYNRQRRLALTLPKQKEQILNFSKLALAESTRQTVTLTPLLRNCEYVARNKTLHCKVPKKRQIKKSKQLLVVKDKQDLILFFSFMTSLIMTIYAMRLNEITVINPKLLYAFSIFGTLLVLFLLRLTKTGSYNFFWTFFIAVGIGGGFSYSSVLILNGTLKDKTILKQEFEIVSVGETAKGKYGKCYPPYAEIDIDGLKKRVVFTCEDKKQIKESSKLSLEFSKGFFGFLVIDSKKLL